MTKPSIVKKIIEIKQGKLFFWSNDFPMTVSFIDKQGTEIQHHFESLKHAEHLLHNELPVIASICRVIINEFKQGKQCQN